MTRWRGLVAVVLIFGVIIGGAVYWAMPEPPMRVSSPLGYVITLQGYNFSSKGVEYRHPRSAYNPELLRRLPRWLRRHFETPVEKQVFATPAIAGEPLLSGAVSVEVTRPDAVWYGRMAVADEEGNEFDPVINNTGEEPKLEVFETPAFPRRSANLKLRIRQGGSGIDLAEFTVPNPAHRIYPQWKAEALPVQTNAGDLQTKLVEFVAERPKEYSAATFPNTSCVIELAQGGRPTTNWMPLKIEVWDATGNHWFPSVDPEQVQYRAGKLHVRFLGALWAGEEAWKVRLDLRQHGGFAQEELLHFEKMPIPGKNEIVRPKLVFEEGNARVEVLGLFGQDVSPEESRKVFLNVNPRLGMVTLAVKLTLADFDRGFSLIGLYDEKGQELQVSEMNRGPIGSKEESYVPFLAYFKVPEGVKNVTMVCAIPKTRQVEFLAKPVQR